MNCPLWIYPLLIFLCNSSIFLLAGQPEQGGEEPGDQGPEGGAETDQLVSLAQSWQLESWIETTS